jgi:hypothetical protein
MSVGGIVIGIKQKADRLCVLVDDKGVQTGVDVGGHPAIQLGDTIWWQGGKVYWTPEGSDREDAPLPKLGYSYRREDWDRRLAG